MRTRHKVQKHYLSKSADCFSNKPAEVAIAHSDSQSDGNGTFNDDSSTQATAHHEIPFNLAHNMRVFFYNNPHFHYTSSTPTDSITSSKSKTPSWGEDVTTKLKDAIKLGLTFISAKTSTAERELINPESDAIAEANIIGAMTRAHSEPYPYLRRNYSHHYLIETKGIHHRKRSQSESALLIDDEGNKSPRKWHY